MAGSPKPQRVRDPLHNLIEFNTDQFEHAMWRVIQTSPFQRLRRIKQLGFSDMVYPGATHTRFAHSLGVFHTARQLMSIIERDLRSHTRQYQEHQAQVAVAAALVHDLGHGMFSHAFEDVGKNMGLEMARHETVSDRLIRGGEVSEALESLGSGFANDVASVINRDSPGNLYDAVVSSQFDADRLDYMQRDRLMTGVQNSGIDFAWLINNLEIGEVDRGVDHDEKIDKIETFVLGPKARYAAETFVLSLFQLYPTIYFHKATRGAEKIFSALISRLMTIAADGPAKTTGLSARHPFIKFAKKPNSLEHALALDDTVFWGALPLLAQATDPLIADCAKRLRERRLPKCIDIRERLCARIKVDHRDKNAQNKRIQRCSIEIRDILKEWTEERSETTPRILIDYTSRDPYKRFQESKGPLNQIRIRTHDDQILDLAESSPVVSGIETFHLFRAYVDAGDRDARSVIEQTIDQVLRSNTNAE